MPLEPLPGRETACYHLHGRARRRRARPVTDRLGTCRGRFQKVIDGREFSPEQRQWLERIRGHLVENLSIEEEDFDTFPIFERAGVWVRAIKVFAGQLPQLISKFNEAIAV